MKWYKITSAENLSTLKQKAHKANRKVVDLTTFGQSSPTNIDHLKLAADAWKYRLKPDDIIVSDVDLTDTLGPSQGDITDMEVMLEKGLPKSETKTEIKREQSDLTAGNATTLQDAKDKLVEHAQAEKEKLAKAIIDPASKQNYSKSLPTPSEIFKKKTLGKTKVDTKGKGTEDDTNQQEEDIDAVEEEDDK